MKIVVVADIHIHPWRLQSRDGGHDRLLDGLSVLDQSLALAKQEGALWVMAGDMKQPKTQWPQSALTGAHEILRRHAAAGVRMLMVVGNHDARGEGGSGLAPFKDCATVVEDARIIEDGATKILCVPWDADLARVRELQDGNTPMVAHGFLAGCMLGTEDTRIAKGNRVEDYGGFPVAWFGDVHKGQWRRPADAKTGRPPEWIEYETIGLIRKAAPWRGEVFYPGSPLMLNWGERNDKTKGALVADLSTGEVWRRELKSPRFIHLEITE